ncbi:MAG TPA: hypothetical protein PKX80_05965 [Flexilinea sp.]|nr:hypothetical protein [Flexilinea sp.]HOP02513.1 hypothetical protein [Flexilinea sp.]HQF80722.1 hypothetical protein [Flexilinea sp.]HQG89041.1 hypothetical protein [Flexilinea sp.]HQJ01541.1 hypothetical protein [Flexilinea sp.]
MDRKRLTMKKIKEVFSLKQSTSSIFVHCLKDLMSMLSGKKPPFTLITMSNLKITCNQFPST